MDAVLSFLFNENLVHHHRFTFAGDGALDVPPYFNFFCFVFYSYFAPARDVEGAIPCGWCLFYVRKANTETALDTISV